MKTRTILQLLATAALAPLGARADIFTKENNGNALNTDVSWVELAVPGVNDTVLFNNVWNSTSKPVLGASRGWNGIQVTDPQKAPRIDYNDGSALTLTVVPEPSTLALAGLAACAITRRRRRHRAA